MTWFVMLTQNKAANRFKGIDLLKRQEGFRAKVYKCPAGKQSIGYGYNLEANPLELSAAVIAGFYKNGITRAEAEQLLIDELHRLESILAPKLDYWPGLNQARQSVLLNMAYNLGVEGLFEFSKTLSFIRRGDYGAAAKEMLNSQWARQVKGRANELSLIMRTGALR